MGDTYDQQHREFFGDLNANVFKPVQANALGGVKFDNNKVRPTLMMRSLSKSVRAVQEVLEFGAKKYAPDNWKLVEPERYDDAALRHIQAYLSGEQDDPETGKPHLAHALCCLFFRLELDLSKSNST